ncbi:MAG: hypothetical protein ACM359_00785 [Bacillota bacterium]
MRQRIEPTARDLAARSWDPAGRRACRSRAGTAYVAIVATALLAATISMGALAVVRAQTRQMNLASDAAEARLYAMSGIELGRLWIAQDPNWRINRPYGTWVSNMPIGGGSVTLEVTDPVDGNLANQPHDPIVMVATGIKGSARHSVEVQLVANPVPLDILKYAVHTGGQLHIHSGDLLKATGATVSANGSLRNDGTIDANVETGTVTATGIVKGSFTSGVAAKPGPDPGIVERYASMGVEIAPGSTIHERVLAPGYTPYGKTHPDGVYVIRTSSDLFITESRIHGTLVVICPGKKVTLGSQVFLEPARAGYPALIVNGNVVLQYDSGTSLSETALFANFNPPGAPYNGVSDNDIWDSYPTEIRGLVHATGTVQVTQDAIVRGAIIAESTASTDAADFSANATIVYKPEIYTQPPPYYTTSVPMIPLVGSWKQRVQ